MKWMTSLQMNSYIFGNDLYFLSFNCSDMSLFPKGWWVGVKGNLRLYLRPLPKEDFWSQRVQALDQRGKITVITAKWLATMLFNIVRYGKKWILSLTMVNKLYIRCKTSNNWVWFTTILIILPFLLLFLVGSDYVFFQAVIKSV